MEQGTVYVLYTKCWSCHMDYHFDPPKVHPWASDEDLAIADDPVAIANQPCGCYCARVDGSPRREFR